MRSQSEASPFESHKQIGWQALRIWHVRSTQWASPGATHHLIVTGGQKRVKGTSSECVCALSSKREAKSPSEPAFRVEGPASRPSAGKVVMSNREKMFQINQPMTYIIYIYWIFKEKNVKCGRYKQCRSNSKWVFYLSFKKLLEFY